MPITVREASPELIVLAGRLAKQQARVDVDQRAGALEALSVGCEVNDFLRNYGVPQPDLEALTPEMFHPGWAGNNSRPVGHKAILAKLEEAAGYFPAFRAKAEATLYKLHTADC